MYSAINIYHDIQNPRFENSKYDKTNDQKLLLTPLFITHFDASTLF